MARIETPVFINPLHRDCYRFIFEEEFLKENYELAGKTYQEVEWEYDDDNSRIVVRLNEKGKSELLIPFCLGSFPMLISLLRSMNREEDE